MWIILGAVAALAVAIYAFWPRKRGIVDGTAISARRSATASIDSATTNIRSQYPIG